MTHTREMPNRTMLHIACSTPQTRASATPTVKYTTHRKRAQGAAKRARMAVLIIFAGFITVVFLFFDADSRVEGVSFLSQSAARLSDIFLMRLSVVSVVSFQGLFGVEVRTYKVFENKYLVAAGRREDFSQNRKARPCTSVKTS